MEAYNFTWVLKNWMRSILYIMYLLNQRETFSSRHLRVTVILSSLYDIASQGYNYIVTRYLATYITFIDRVCNDSSCED